MKDLLTLIAILLFLILLYIIAVAFGLFGATLPVDPATVSAPLY